MLEKFNLNISSGDYILSYVAECVTGEYDYSLFPPFSICRLARYIESKHVSLTRE